LEQETSSLEHETSSLEHETSHSPSPQSLTNW
jgi:hypothetical protein